MEYGTMYLELYGISRLECHGMSWNVMECHGMLKPLYPSRCRGYRKSTRTQEPGPTSNPDSETTLQETQNSREYIYCLVFRS